jgi:hypothetical protein
MLSKCISLIRPRDRLMMFITEINQLFRLTDNPNYQQKFLV